MNLAPNIWYLENMAMLTDFLARGGRVVLVAEGIDPNLKDHPLCLPASILLPPFEAVSADIDGDRSTAENIYNDYLGTEEPDMYITAIAASIIQNVPIGLYFGTDEMEIKFSMMFMNYLYNFYGITVGWASNTNPVIPAMNQLYLPMLLAKLYMKNLIDYRILMEEHPDVPFSLPELITKMAFEINPLVKEKNFEDYRLYFERVKKIIKENGNRFLYDPIMRAE